jgi:hypothetical protein
MVDNGSITNAVTVNPQSFVTQAYSAVVVTPGRYTNVSPRIDYQLNDKNTLMFRYGITHSAAAAKRFQEQKPAPGGEAALRRNRRVAARPTGLFPNESGACRCHSPAVTGSQVGHCSARRVAVGNL